MNFITIHLRFIAAPHVDGVGAASGIRDFEGVGSGRQRHAGQLYAAAERELCGAVALMNAPMADDPSMPRSTTPHTCGRF